METKSFEEILNEEGFLLYKCSGISMKPLIKEDRDLVFIKKAEGSDFHKYDVALYLKHGTTDKNKYVLHRIVKINNDGTYYFLGDNCIEGETVKKENVLGTLIEIRRGHKTISTSSVKYKLYTFIWCRPWKLRISMSKLNIFIKRIFNRILRTLHVKKGIK